MSIIEMNSREIMEEVAHRFPMLLVDRIFIDTDADPVVIKGIKNITCNDVLIQESGNQAKRFPHMLVVEAAGQMTLAGYSRIGLKLQMAGGGIYLARIKDAWVKDKVIAGDQISMIGTHLGGKNFIHFFKCQAFVGDQQIMQAKIASVSRKG